MARSSSGTAVVEVTETTITSNGTLPGAAPRWNAWPVYWSAIWVGVLASVAAVVLFGLVGAALGAHALSGENRWVHLREVGWGTMIFGIFGAFFAFVLGGWITTKIAGILRSETAMLHGGITWLVAMPLLLVLIALGAGSLIGGWYTGLAGQPGWGAGRQPPYLAPVTPLAGATAAEIDEYRDAMKTHRERIRQWHADSPKVARNSAIGAVTILLLSLVGSVIGGWLGSGEPMNFTHYRTRGA